MYNVLVSDTFLRPAIQLPHISAALLYGSEMILSLACKRILNVAPKVCNYTVLGDTGRLPMYMFIICCQELIDILDTFDEHALTCSLMLLKSC